MDRTEDAFIQISCLLFPCWIVDLVLYRSGISPLDIRVHRSTVQEVANMKKNKGSKKSGTNGSGESGFVILGVLLMVIGLICLLYSAQQSTWGGLSSETIYPYRGIGVILVIIGIVAFMVGLFVDLSRDSKQED